MASVYSYILEMINSGKYEAWEPYVSYEKDKEGARKYERSAYDGKSHFKQDLFENYEILDNPKKELCFEIAWDDGHSGGFAEVLNQFDKLVCLIK